MCCGNQCKSYRRITSFSICDVAVLRCVLLCVTAGPPTAHPDIVELPTTPEQDKAFTEGAAAAALLAGSQRAELDPSVLAEVGLVEAVGKAQRDGREVEKRGLQWAADMLKRLKAKEAAEEEERLREEAEMKAEMKREERREKRAKKKRLEELEAAQATEERKRKGEDEDDYTHEMKKGRIDTAGSLPLPALKRTKVHLFDLVLGLGMRPDLVSTWQSMMHDRTLQPQATWYSPFLSIDAQHSDLPGAWQGPASSSTMDVPEGWLSVVVVELGLAAALHIAPSPDVWILPHRDYDAAVALTGGYCAEEGALLISRNSSLGWMVTLQNVVMPTLNGSPTSGHWQLVLYSQAQHLLYILDSSDFVTPLSPERRRFFMSLCPNRVLKVASRASLNVQQDGSSCGCHMVAAFLIWLGGGDVNDMRITLGDDSSRDVTMALLAWGAFSKVLGPVSTLSPTIYQRLQAERDSVRAELRMGSRAVSVCLRRCCCTPVVFVTSLFIRVSLAV
jgi:hypothetical protein